MKRFEAAAFIAVLAASSAFARDVVSNWSGPAPEDLPAVNVRYEDAARQVLIVEGADYRARVRLRPAEILSLEVNGREQLAAPMVPGFVDDQGVRYVPQGEGVPNWMTYQGQSYKPARSAAARVNVWNAGPYYWDAHVLDIPLVPEKKAAAPQAEKGALLKGWTFADGVQGWGNPVNQCSVTLVDGALRVEYDGDDPWFNAPPCTVDGPLEIVVRLRSETGGTAQLYYATGRAGYGEDTRLAFEVEGGWQWRDVRIPWHVGERLNRFRIDPPGEAGVVELSHVQLRQVDASVLAGPVVRGGIVLHAFADRLNIEFHVAPEETGVVPARASWDLQAPGIKPGELEGRPLVQLADVAILGLPGQPYEAGRLEAPLRPSALSAQAPRGWWVLRPIEHAQSLQQLFQEELKPLPADHFSIRNGRYLGYDAAAGLHTVDAITTGLSFNAAYDNPNRRIAIPMAIRSDGRQRRLLVKSVSHVGMLPATVLADEHGFMLPTPVLSCKNFQGEREEPDDSGYGNAFFPIELEPGEEKRFQILHLFQNWGDHMLKQVSSIRFFHIYWHLSTGVSETTCFTIPSMKLNRVWVRIPDFRPYSGPFWKEQPQHDYQSWPGLLQYQGDGGEVRLVYEKTVFESIAPNLALFTLHFTSSDGAARATARVLEIPQNDEARTFLQIRYDFDRDVSIRGDARDAFRWLNINDKQVPRNLVYLDRDGQAVAHPIRSGSHQALGQELAAEFPFVGTHGMPGNQGTTYYSSMALVRGFKARLGGMDQDRVFFSAQYGARSGNYWLTTRDEALEIRAGDYIEAEIMLLPHAEGTEPLVVPGRERRDYGTEGPKAVVATGSLAETFPATVVAENEVVALSVEGGTAATPIIAKGFSHWAVPLLWINGRWQNQQAHGGDGYQVNPDGDGSYRFTFLVQQRQGHPRKVMVTRAECSTGISRTTDLSGYLELATDAEVGTFTLRAPMLPGRQEDDFRPRTAAIFAPGRNTITAGEPATAFVGTARSVRQIPLNVVPAGGTVEVTVTRYDERKMTLAVSGAATLEFDALAGGSTYRLAVGGREEIRHTPANARQVTATVDGGVHEVSLEYLATDWQGE